MPPILQTDCRFLLQLEDRNSMEFQFKNSNWKNPNAIEWPALSSVWSVCKNLSLNALDFKCDKGRFITLHTE